MTTHQLRRAWLEEDGEGVAHAGDAVDEREEDDVVLPDGGPGVVEEVEHGEVDDGLDDGVEVVYGVLGHEVGQGAHPGCSLPPVVDLVKGEGPQGSNLAQQGCMRILIILAGLELITGIQNTRQPCMMHCILTDCDDSVRVSQRSKRLVAHFGQCSQAYPGKTQYQVVHSLDPRFPEPLLPAPAEYQWLIRKASFFSTQCERGCRQPAKIGNLTYVPSQEVPVLP